MEDSSTLGNIILFEWWLISLSMVGLGREVLHISIPCLYTLSLYESGSRVLALSSYLLNVQGFVVLWPPRLHWLHHRLRIGFQDYSQMTSNRRIYSVAKTPHNCSSLLGQFGQYFNLGVKLYSRNIGTTRHLTQNWISIHNDTMLNDICKEFYNISPHNNI